MTQTPTDALRLVPIETVTAWKKKAENRFMTSSIDEYCPEEFLTLADAYIALAAAPASPLPGGGEAEFEIIQNEDHAASVSGPRDRAYAEAKHYAAIYGQDGPVEVFEVIRRPVPELSSAAPTGEPK